MFLHFASIDSQQLYVRTKQTIEQLNYSLPSCQEHTYGIMNGPIIQTIHDICAVNALQSFMFCGYFLLSSRVGDQDQMLRLGISG